MKFTEEHKTYIDNNFKLMRTALINLGALKYTEEGWEATDIEKSNEVFLQQLSDSIKQHFQAVIRATEAQSIQLEKIYDQIKNIQLPATPHIPPINPLNLPVDLGDIAPKTSETHNLQPGNSEVTTSSSIEDEVNILAKQPKNAAKTPIVNGKPRLKERIKAEKEHPPIDLLADQVSRNALKRQ